MSDPGLLAFIGHLHSRGVTLHYDGETLLLRWPTSRDAPGLRRWVRHFYDGLAHYAERVPGPLDWQCWQCGQAAVSDGAAGQDRCPYCEDVPTETRGRPVKPISALPAWHPRRVAS